MRVDWRRSPCSHRGDWHPLRSSIDRNGCSHRPIVGQRHKTRNLTEVGSCCCTSSFEPRRAARPTGTRCCCCTATTLAGSTSRPSSTPSPPRASASSSPSFGATAAPMLRLHGQLKQVKGNIYPPQEIAALIDEILTLQQQEYFAKHPDLDFCYDASGIGRFRANILKQRKGYQAVFRVIPPTPPALESLGFPELVSSLTRQHQGLILVTGPSGCGKSRPYWEATPQARHRFLLHRTSLNSSAASKARPCRPRNTGILVVVQAPYFRLYQRAYAGRPTGELLEVGIGGPACALQAGGQAPQFERRRPGQ